MKKFSSFLFLFLFLANCSALKKDPSFLFIQSATKASFNGKALVLNKISSRLTYFSDRPYRIVGTVENKKFKEIWNNRTKNSFAKDAPNAWISYYDKNGKMGSAIAEISNFKLEKNSVSYEIKILEGQLSEEMQNVSVVIDNLAVKGYMSARDIVQGVM